jgi:hypothetical protein
VPIRVILVKLKPGVDPAAYEEFVRRVDYPIAVTRTSIPYYRNHRIRPESWSPGPGAWDYVEYIQATDVAAYDAERAANPNREFQRLNPEYVERTVSFWADAIEPDAS